MSSSRSVEDFLEFLVALDEAGFAYAIIGGCAVGAYARLTGASVISADLDLYVPSSTLPELLAWVESLGDARVLNRPAACTVPAAVIEWRGEEVNLLTASRGLPPPERVLETAREVELAHRAVVVHLADPFDLLANKLAIRRPKDEPHIVVLTHYVEQEVVAEFTAEGPGRRRLAPARRLLEVLKTDELPEELAGRLIPLATKAALRRFLIAHVPRREQAQEILGKAEHPEERTILERIIASRAMPVEG